MILFAAGLQDITADVSKANQQILIVSPMSPSDQTETLASTGILRHGIDSRVPCLLDDYAGHRRRLIFGQTSLGGGHSSLKSCSASERYIDEKEPVRAGRHAHTGIGMPGNDYHRG